MGTGCASLGYRTSASNNKVVSPGIYPGVRTDFLWIKEYAGDHPVEEYSLAGPVLDVLKFIVIPVAVIDSPLSFILDTVLLPIDLWSRTSERHEESRQEK